MKVMSINANTSFKGVFTNKSAENNGNWLMVYEPYSWESKNTGIMDLQKDFSVYDNFLPDNEKIYTDVNNKKSCEDIMGTEFYYEYKDGRARKHITERPSLNREDSLKVVDKKLDRFLRMKQGESNALMYKMTEPDVNAKNAIDKYFYASRDFDDGYEYSKGFLQKGDGISLMNSARSSMDIAHNNLVQAYNDTKNLFDKYVKLMGSMEAVRYAKQNCLQEIKQLEELRNSDKLIDISRRDLKGNPNIPLLEAFQNLKSLAEKYLCLPHKTVSMKEIMNAVKIQNLTTESEPSIIAYIEHLIKASI